MLDLMPFLEQETNSNNQSDQFGLLLRVLDLLPNPVYVKDRQHSWIQVNAAFCNFLGYPREVLIGKSDYDFNPPDQAKVFWDSDNDVFDRKAENSNLEETTNSQGDALWVESRKSYYVSEDGSEYLIGVLTDVTALKHAEEMAQAAVKAKAEFLANMSHEIRTPMNGVLGMAQMLRQTVHAPKQIQMFDLMQKSGESLLRVINDILDLSKFEAGQMDILSEIFDLREVLESTMVLFGHAAREKGLNMVLDIPPHFPSQLRGDPVRLGQILTNLVGNAVKFTESGFVNLTVKGEMADGVANIQFLIEDSGIGMSPDVLERIFDKFQQADTSTTRIYGGTGLGLAICKTIVDLMHGHLKVSSVLGAGTVFDVNLRFPIVEMSEPSLEYKFSERKKFLIVESSKESAAGLLKDLSPVTNRSNVVSSVRDAAKSLVQAYTEGKAYEVVVVGLGSNEADVNRFVRSIRQQSELRQLQIVILASVNDASLKGQYSDMGADVFLLRPARQSDLIRGVLEKSSARLHAA